ncbi:DUF3592 domain-containing protein [Cohaesibacter celericrescens]|nr:DUF3592 domain-containing protein [Cohaesibacter celericrescens]
MTDQTTSKRGLFSPIAFLFLAIALGGFVYAGLGFVGLHEAQIPDSWQQAPGQIVDTGITVGSQDMADGSKLEVFQPKVRYRYEVGGKFLLGEQLSRHHPMRSLRGVAETEIEDLHQGTNVTVYFDPENPADAVLRKSDTIGPMQAISSGLAIGLTCFAIFVVSLRRWRKVTPKMTA